MRKTLHYFIMAFVFFICSFSLKAQTAGDDCSNPILVTTLPYTTSDDTANYSNYYSGSQEMWLSGNDVVYHYQPSADGAIFIKLSNISDEGAGIFVYEDCSDIDVAAPLVKETNVYATSDLIKPITEVNAGSDYYIVVSSVDIAPVSTQTISYTLEIESTDPCNPPENIQVSNISTVGADFSWNSNPAINYDWYVFESGAIVDPNSPYVDTPVLQGNTAANAIVTSGLIPDRAYDFYVVSECSNPIGNLNSDWSDPLTFNTLECAAPTDFVITNQTYNSVDVSWTENGNATEWELLYVKTGYNPFLTGVYIVDADGVESENIDNLLPNTGYDVYIRSVCSGYGGDWTGPATFYTLECAIPTDIAIANQTGNSVDISWTENGSATQWEIKYGGLGFDPASQGQSVLDTDGLIGETLTGLTEGVDYEAYVRSLCSVDLESGWSAPYSFTSLGLNAHHQDKLSYYPNPVQESLTIQAFKTIKKLSLYNIQGSLMREYHPGNSKTTINLSELPTGVYLMRVVFDPNKNTTYKIVKK